ncbi:DUF732 domain-containing protein [Mycolicibacterium tusciae]|uniref:DUF732 domain-containing protein n=1 Tax=Mycolicibacterium tusciae TaxID=75922 RepID=UPI0003176D98|nr:DUF732 domain-containing protein [Mycolicibacterium tusciae]
MTGNQRATTIVVAVLAVILSAGIWIWYVNRPDPSERAFLADNRVAGVYQDDSAALSQAQHICAELKPIASQPSLYNTTHLGIAWEMAGPTRSSTTIDTEWENRVDRAEGFIDAAVDHLCQTRSSG